MRLTGLSQETSLSDGRTMYYLVFNHGELRIPTQESSIELLISYINNQTRQLEEEIEEPQEEEQEEFYDDVNDGVGSI